MMKIQILRRSITVSLLFFWSILALPAVSHAAYIFDRAWGWGVTDGTSAFQICTSTSTCRAGVAGSGIGQFNSPFGIASDSSGNVYVVDTSNNRIQKFDSSGTFVSQWGSLGSGNGQLNNPRGIALDSSGNSYVTEVSAANSRVQKFSSTGAFLTKWGSLGPGNGQFNLPEGVALDSAGNVYVADTSNQRIEKFNSAGTYITKWGSAGAGNGQFSGPEAIAIDSSDNIYVVDRLNSRIQKFDTSGTYISQWGSFGSGNGQFNSPELIAVDSSGNVYVVDDGNRRIEKFDSSGTYLSQWGSLGSGNGQFNNPRGISVDASGNVYVADLGNNRIHKFIHNLLPAVSTNNASSASSSSATLNAAIFDPGGASASTRGFAYGLTTSYGATTTESGAFISGTFSAAVSNLACGQTYHFRAYVVGAAGTSTGSDLTFYTFGPCSSVITSAASDVAPAAATLNGSITNKGLAAATIRGFNYGTTANYGATTTENGLFFPGAFTSAITGLACNTNYHFRAFVVNTDGLSYGADRAFRTGAVGCTPRITTGAASSITTVSATLNGSVSDSGGGSTLTLDGAHTTTVANNIILRGTNGNLLLLRSTIPDTPALIDISNSGTRDIQYADIKDSNNSNAAAVACFPGCVDSGNTINWVFH